MDSTIKYGRGPSCTEYFLAFFPFLRFLVLASTTGEAKRRRVNALVILNILISWYSSNFELCGILTKKKIFYEEDNFAARSDLTLDTLTKILVQTYFSTSQNIFLRAPLAESVVGSNIVWPNEDSVITI